MRLSLPLVASVFFVSTVPAIGQDTTDQDLIETASELDTGMGAELYFYITRPTRSFEDVVKILPAHMDFVHTIEDGGIMVMGGQITPEGADDAGGLGIIVIRASSFEEARAIADRDPAHASGARTYELYKWNINEGSTTIRLKFSDQTFVLE
ncbi:MAG: YciI family protein [Pseudomonadota bacterium]